MNFGGKLIKAAYCCFIFFLLILDSSKPKMYTGRKVPDKMCLERKFVM